MNADDGEGELDVSDVELEVVLANDVPEVSQKTRRRTRRTRPRSKTIAMKRMTRAELQAGAMKNPQKAIGSLNELIDRFPGEGRYPENALMRLGSLHRSIKKPDGAIAAYEKLILRYPESSQVRAAWLGIAYCHEEKGDAQRAIDVLRAIMRKFPRTSEASLAHTRLEQVYKIPDVDVSDR